MQNLGMFLVILTCAAEFLVCVAFFACYLRDTRVYGLLLLALGAGMFFLLYLQGTFFPSFFGIWLQNIGIALHVLGLLFFVVQYRPMPPRHD